MSNVFQTYFKGFKLKKLVVESKTARSVELDEEPVNPNSIGRGVQKTFSFFQNGCSTGQCVNSNQSTYTSTNQGVNSN